MRKLAYLCIGALLWAQPDPQAKEELNKNIRFYRSIARRTGAFRTKALPKLNGIRWQVKIQKRRLRNRRPHRRRPTRLCRRQR